jgi:hypothetical protein
MDDPSHCPRCGQQMKLVDSLPAEGGFPAVEGFRCEQCNEEITGKSNRAANRRGLIHSATSSPLSVADQLNISRTREVIGTL